MTDTQDLAYRLATLLAWYREMGVTAALDETPIDWCKRGDAAPGVSFVMPVRQPRVPAPTPSPSANPAIAPASIARGGPAPLTSPAQPPIRRAPLSTAPPPPAAVRAFSSTPAPTVVVEARVTAQTLSELAAALSVFEGCGLKATAKHLCLYRGAERARVMVIGEAPGRDDDLTGETFSGPQGQLLEHMLAALSLPMAQVHLTNVVYWRPPGNRAATAQETQACAPFLTRQIELVAPEFILLLGGNAAKAILATDDSIMKIRGKWRTLTSGDRPIKALATLHPAQVLRTPSYKRQVWRDLLTFQAGL